jgi:radical SAM superfamily enzyme YgiQ (UPF0313 family)
MRLTLVQPPNGYLDRYDLAPPAGLLSLAAAVRAEGVVPTLVDMNLRGMQDRRALGDDFYERTVALIADTQPDIVGFTSMALESHVCLELARQLKQLDPKVIIVMGGPHFTAIARETLTLYPWVDHVVTGEGEQALTALIRYLRGEPAELVNVASRRKDSIELRRGLKTLGSLEQLPFPAYDIVDLDAYFALNPMRLMNFDSGRGCIFRCSFCYSPGQWGQGEQVKSPDRVVEEVGRHYELGARHLFFVQDNLVNSVQGTLDLCQALIEARSPMTWNAYTTMQRLTPKLLDPLAEAGCREVFVGVDAVSARSQQAFGKHFFKGWDSLRQRLTDCLDRGIVPTCAFMVDLPAGADHEDTDRVLTTALLARNLGCGIRLNTLTVYNDTATAKEFAGHERSYSELKPRLLLDTPPVVVTNPYAKRHPELFPFHSTLLPLPVYERFVTAMHIAYTLFSSFSRTLLQYVVTENGSPWLLLNRIADRIGDITPIDARLRRHRERQVFQEEFSGLTVSRRTREAFELERTELELSVTRPSQPLRVSSDGAHGWYRSEAHEVIRLSGSPASLSRDDGAEQPDGAGSYLVLREGDQLRYFLVEEGLIGELARIRRSRSSGKPLELPPEVLAELTLSGILTPIKEVASA